MGFLRKLYPGAFKLEKKVVKPFVIKLVVFAIIYLVASVIIGALMATFGLVGAASSKAVVGIICYLVILLLGLVDLVLCAYTAGGVVISILKFVGVIKDQTADVENTNLNNAAGKVGGVFDKVVGATENVVNKVVDKATEKKDDKAENAEETENAEENAAE